jgi:hypothetical protein
MASVRPTGRVFPGLQFSVTRCSEQIRECQIRASYLHSEIGDGVKVEYNRDEQLRRCRRVVNEVLAFVADPTLPKALQTVDTNSIFGYSTILRAVSEILSEEIMGFKNEAFVVEQEWRLVVRKRDLLKQGLDDAGKAPLPVYFRSSNGMLVPYVKLLPAKQGAKLPLTSVRSGPTLEKITACLGVIGILEQNGFLGVRIQGSDISVKF